MDKIKKSRVLELSEILIKKNNQIKKNAALEVYISCQEAAISLGKYLELEEGKFLGLIKLLEEYCEFVYRLINLTDEKHILEIYKKNKIKLQLLKKTIEDEITIRKKLIVFLPYKASMWDSMESVWKAAMEDETCIVQVVPIPYFDKLRDGTFGVMHDEGSQYPDYVSIMNWEEYDISLNKPDILYLHNPYDDANYSTTIHPQFYTTKLKKDVRVLVYIPYFVVPFSHLKSHLCILPGTFLTDYMIVQSEEIREIYLKEMKKFEKENGCEGQFGNLENKVLALGSPKYDKVLQSKKSDYLIPPEWEQIISKKNQEKCKILLFNTSIASMLEYGIDMIYKIEKVFEVLKNHKNIVLLWRPHPLLPVVIDTIKPELKEPYMKIVDEFREEAWGIYDDSDDLNRSIAISDAYYGDGGSVFELYRITGKPVMIYNPRVTNINEQEVNDGTNLV